MHSDPGYRHGIRDLIGIQGIGQESGDLIGSGRLIRTHDFDMEFGICSEKELIRNLGI